MSSLLNKSVASIRNVVDPYKLDIQQMNHQKCKPTLEVKKKHLTYYTPILFFYTA